MTKVAIVIPTYNRAGLIGPTIESALRQTHENIDLLVIDDASEDTTNEVVSGYSDPRLRYIRLPEKKGAQHARNVGTRSTNADYITYLDSDDLFAPDKIEIQLEPMLKDPELDAAICQTRFFSETPGDSPYVLNRLDSSDVLARFLMRDMPWSGIAPLWRTEFIHKIGLWSEHVTVNQDYDMHLRALCHRPKIHVQPEPAAFWRQHEQGRIMDLQGLSRERSYGEIVTRSAKLMKDVGLYNSHYRFYLGATFLRQSLSLARLGDRRSATAYLGEAIETYFRPYRKRRAQAFGPLAISTLARSRRGERVWLRLMNKLDVLYPIPLWWKQYTTDHTFEPYSFSVG